MLSIQKLLEEHATPKQVNKGEYWIREGQYAKSIAFVSEGYLRSFQIDYKGNDVSVNFFQSQQFCGAYYSFYAQAPALFTIEALTDCKLQLIAYDTLMHFYQDNLEVNIMGRQLIEEVCIQKDLRIAKMLQLDAEQRYQWFLNAYPDLIKVTQLRHIASFLGMKAETLSRIRRKPIT